MEIWEAGSPYIENYSTDVYKHSPWNFEITGGNNGFMYMGNAEGILEFDGVSWGYIPTEYKNWIMAFAQTDDEKIYVGGIQDFGYIEPDSFGKMKFHSLIPFLASEYTDFGSVSSIISIGSKVYYSTFKYLFEWDGKKFKVWYPTEEFGEVFKVNGSLYINDLSVGLQKLVGDSLQEVPGAEVLIGNDAIQADRIRDMLPYKKDQILILHSHKGLLRYDGENFAPFNERSNAALLKSNLYKGVRLNDGDYAIATLINGLYILDGKTGEIKKRLGKKHGLTSNEIYAIYEDSNAAIWVCGGEGISKIEWASPFRVFNESSGLNEIVTSVFYQSGSFLVDCNGLYFLKKSETYSEDKELNFTKIEGMRAGRLRGTISNKKDILTRNESQVYTISDTYDARLILEINSDFTSFIASTADKSKFYFATREQGLFDLTLIENQWITRPLLQPDGVIISIIEEPEGNLWLSIHEKGLYYLNKVSEIPEEQTQFEIEKYDTLSGLPSMSNIYPALYQNALSVSTQDGYYKFNQRDQIFEKDSLWPNQYDETNEDYRFEFLDKNEDVWHTIRTNDVTKIFKLSENKLSEISEYKLFSGYRVEGVELMDEIVLFVTRNGILMYNQNEARSFKRNLNTKLRRVWVNNDSLVYAGSDNYKSKDDRFEIPFKSNALKFEYTLPFYTKSEKNVYQYFLEGFEDDWSSWSSEIKKGYTNLPAGDYTFKVRSKNIYDEMGGEDRYSFTILPPWQRTWWAYMIYALGIITLVSLIIHWRSKVLIKQNESLEETIAQRTLEIQNKNKLLNHQTEQLVEKNQLKTQLYSNISHEFRTPLTVIIGMADELKSDIENQNTEHTEKSLEVIRRNGKNLLQMVNELLDIAKLESGSMELDLVQIDVVPFVKYFSESFHSLAETKKINLAVYSEIEFLEMDIDVNKLGSILSNLLSNAIKFTPENGKIILHINRVKKAEKEALEIKVQDNGHGIAEKDRMHLFDRFYQAANSSYGQQVGTGIGLALTKEFVELMKGEISVASSSEKGTTFLVQIPITNNAIKNGEPVFIEPSIKMPPPEYKQEPVLDAPINDLPLLLIIEDNLDVTRYLESCLQGKYQTIHAVDGEIGIRMAFENIPDIIISDVMMPQKDGYEVCAAIKADERTDHIPIILLTAKVTTEDRLTGLAHGADAYLTKPFNKDELFTRIDQLILVRKKLISKLEKKGFSVFLKEKVDDTQTKFVQEVIKLVHSNLDDSNFGPTLLAAEMRLSESQIYRKLKAITDKSTAVFIRSVRLQKAKELLQKTNKTVSEIAYEVGFNDPSWFSRSFKEEFGVPPSDVGK